MAGKPATPGGLVQPSFLVDKKPSFPAPTAEEKAAIKEKLGGKK